MATRSSLFFLISILTNVAIVQSDCNQTSLRVKASNSQYPCKLSFSKCSNGSYEALNYCYSYYSDCSVVSRGGCRTEEIDFNVPTQCLANCCDSKSLQFCVENYQVIDDTMYIQVWVIVLIVVVVVIFLVILGICMYIKYKASTNLIDLSANASQVNDKNIKKIDKTMISEIVPSSQNETFSEHSSSKKSKNYFTFKNSNNENEK